MGDKFGLLKHCAIHIRGIWPEQLETKYPQANCQPITHTYLEKCLAVADLEGLSWLRPPPPLWAADRRRHDTPDK